MKIDFANTLKLTAKPAVNRKSQRILADNTAVLKHVENNWKRRRRSSTKSVLWLSVKSR